MHVLADRKEPSASIFRSLASLTYLTSYTSFDVYKRRVNHQRKLHVS